MSLLIMSLVIAVVGGLLVHYFLATRDADLRRINCGIIDRQVAGQRLLLAQAKMFRDHDTSPEIRAYFATVVPVRRKGLAAAAAEQKRLNCQEDS